MTLLALHPEAGEELVATVSWYEQRESGLGVRFYGCVQRRVAQASRWQKSGSPVLGFLAKHDVRRFVVRGFPYSVITALVQGQRLVVAVAHTRRAPGYWQERLK